MPEATLQVIMKLVSEGALGAVCVVLILALVALYKAKEKAQHEYASEVKNLHIQHDKEMQELMERHIQYAEAWVENGNQLAQNLNTVLESITRKRE